MRLSETIEIFFSFRTMQRGNKGHQVKTSMQTNSWTVALRNAIVPSLFSITNWNQMHSAHITAEAGYSSYWFICISRNPRQMSTRKSRAISRAFQQSIWNNDALLFGYQTRFNHISSLRLRSRKTKHLQKNQLLKLYKKIIFLRH